MSHPVPPKAWSARLRREHEERQAAKGEPVTADRDLSAAEVQEDIEHARLRAEALRAPVTADAQQDPTEKVVEVFVNVLLASRQSAVADLNVTPRQWGEEAARQLAPLIAAAEKRAAAAVREPFETLLAKWDETIAHYGVPTTAPLYRSAEELRAALASPAPAPQGEEGQR